MEFLSFCSHFYISCGYNSSVEEQVFSTLVLMFVLILVLAIPLMESYCMWAGE